MAFRIGRTLPPAAAPIRFTDILSGIAGLVHGNKEVTRFEQELKEHFLVRHCFAVSSGKAALVLILQALHELSPDRDEVLIPAYTCYSVPSAIVRAGLRVRLCDVSRETLDFDYGRLAEEIDNPRLLAVVPTHLFGLPSDVAMVRDTVRGRGIFVIEDAAQAMGADWNGRKLGTQGDIGLFSMGRGKAFATVEGGVLLTDDDRIGRAIGTRLSAIEEYGGLEKVKLLVYALVLAALIHPLLFWLPKSLPFLKLGETLFDTSFPLRKLSAFQAGLAGNWKERSGSFRKARAENVEKLAGCGVPAVGVTGERAPDLIRYPILLPDKVAKQALLRKSGVMGLGIADGYPDSIDGIGELGFRAQGKVFPAAQEIAERLVTLPVHPFVNGRDMGKIVKLLKSMIGRG
jgi:dTDP-4-amino-4,6-dideoxygalactose transaminase